MTRIIPTIGRMLRMSLLPSLMLHVLAVLITGDCQLLRSYLRSLIAMSIIQQSAHISQTQCQVITGHLLKVILLMLDTVRFDDGVSCDRNKSNYSHYVRAVRGEPLSHNFQDNVDGTVTDTSTGLMWQQATAPGDLTWSSAQLL